MSIPEATISDIDRRPEAPPRITVVHLIHTMAYGGIETVLINWLTAIDRTRFDVRLVCFANPGGTERPFVSAAETAGLSVSKIPWHRGKPVWRAARALGGLCRGWGAHILHTHNVYADLVGLLAARFCRVRTVTTLYVWGDFGWKRNLLQALDAWVVRRFDKITAHCEETRRQSVARGFSAEDIDLLICGYEAHAVQLAPEERRRRRRALGLAEDAVLLANVSRLYPEKAQDSLLRCFKDIQARVPQSRLFILGVGPLEAQLKSLCTRLGLDPFVTFVGFSRTLHEFLALVDIQVHPSHMEGVPLAVCAGMAAGLPIVASRVGGLCEVLADGRTGRLVPPGDDAGFVDAVVDLIMNPGAARRLGLAAQHFITHDYSLQTAVKRVESTYHRLVAPCVSASS